MTPDRNWHSAPLAELGLSIRALKTAEMGLRQAGYREPFTVGELCELTADEVVSARGFGETSLREIEAKFAELGLKFRVPAPDEGVFSRLGPRQRRIG